MKVKLRFRHFFQFLLMAFVAYHGLVILALRSSDPIYYLELLGNARDSTFFRATPSSPRYDPNSPIDEIWLNQIECLDRNILNRGQLLLAEPAQFRRLDVIHWRLAYAFKGQLLPNWNGIESYAYWLPLVSLSFLDNDSRNRLSLRLILTRTGKSKSEICSEIYGQSSDACFNDPESIMAILYPLVPPPFNEDPFGQSILPSDEKKEMKDNVAELKKRCPPPTRQ